MEARVRALIIAAAIAGLVLTGVHTVSVEPSFAAATSKKAKSEQMKKKAKKKAPKKRKGGMAGGGIGARAPGGGSETSGPRERPGQSKDDSGLERPRPGAQ